MSPEPPNSTSAQGKLPGTASFPLFLAISARKLATFTLRAGWYARIIMACSFGIHLLHAYSQSVIDARLPSSTPRKQAQADVALMALLTHEKECRACRQQAPSLHPQSILEPQPA